MEKKYYAMKLIPCRPDFAMTMTDAERGIMMQHVGYWQGHMAKGSVLVFGPVMDPKGPYGLGIVAVENEEEVKAFIANDPSTSINTYEYYPMMAVVPQK